MSISEQSDVILRATGDLLLQLGTDTPRRVLNNPVNASQLNAAVTKYQRHLDALELDIVRSINAARRKTTQPPVDTNQATSGNQAQPDHIDLTAAEQPDGPEREELDLGFDQAGLDQGLDADLFDMDNGGLGLFGEASPAQNYSMDDGFF